MSAAYIPAPAAQLLSDALWGLARPPAVRGAKDTQYLFPWVTALDGSLWLLVDTGYAIALHEAAELSGIAGILAPYVGHGIEQADIDWLEQLVVESRGRRLVIYEAFPPIFKLKDAENPNGLGRTRAQLVEEKKLNAPLTIP